MNSQEGLLAYRDELIEKCTGYEFGRTHGEQIGQVLQPVVDAESRVATEMPELYVFPPRAGVEIPSSFNPVVRDEIDQEWQKYTGRMQDPDHFSNILAFSETRPHTWLKYDTSVPLLKADCATLHCLELDGVHLPLRISVNRGEAMVLPKQGIPDDLFADIVTTLVRVFEDEETAGKSDEELRADVLRRNSLTDAEEFLPLRLLAESPDEFCRLIDARTLSVQPSRLMTSEEAGEWVEMARDVMSRNQAGEDVVVGEKGYGSYSRWQGQWDIGAGVVLARIDLNSDGSESIIQKKAFLAPVTDGGREVGSTVCKVGYYPPHDEFYVSFDHGESDLYWYRQWRRQSEGLNGLQFRVAE
jgi:hypothetical protein